MIRTTDFSLQNAHYQHFRWTKVCGVLLFIFLFCLGEVVAQQPEKLTPELKKEIILKAGDFLVNKYLSPEKGSEMAAYIRSQLDAGVYKDIENAEEFAEKVSQDLHSVQQDLHLLLYYGMKEVDVFSDQESDIWYYQEARRRNFGFYEMRIMDGNVGYLRLDEFSIWTEAQKVATAAMQFLVHADAVIIDLRYNGGGTPEMVQYIASYFFPKRSKTVFHSIYFRTTRKTVDYKNLKKLEGHRIETQPVFFLTGENTASGAEALAFSLQTHGRAKVVGDTTVGAANTAQSFALPGGFRIFLSVGQPVVPGDKPNWEGTGVFPDSSVAESRALNVAYLLAIKKIFHSTKDKDHGIYLKNIIQKQEVKLYQHQLSAEVLQKMAGVYGDRVVTFKNGKLYYRNTNKHLSPTRLLGLPDGSFVFESKQTMLEKLPRIRFEWDKEQTTGYTVTFPSGKTRIFKKTIAGN